MASARRQVVLHLVLLLVPILVLPIGINTSLLPSSGGNPILAMLLMLLAAVGLPFFVLSTTFPLLQSWFAKTGHPGARDPYFLYSASNAGSMLGLLSYPVVIAFVPLAGAGWLSQTMLWAVGYGVLALLISACAVTLWCSRSEVLPVQAGEKKLESLSWHESCPTTIQCLRWVALAFVPSSLWLGVTTYLTEDLFPDPMLWVIPFALYLLSFILVFARPPRLLHTILAYVTPFVLLIVLFYHLTEWSLPLWIMLFGHLALLFLVAMVCHGEIALSRPAAGHLTAFYLWMAVGGDLGGVFNALVAPLLFYSRLEYPLAMAFACFLLPLGKRARDSVAMLLWDLITPIALGLLALLLFIGSHAFSLNLAPITRGLVPSKEITESLITIGLPLLLGVLFIRKPLRFGLCILTVLLVAVCCEELPLYQTRSFFGVLKVTRKDSWHYLYHGTTLHGTQYILEGPKPPCAASCLMTSPLAPMPQFIACLGALDLEVFDRQREPLSYYHRLGPIGQLFRDLRVPKGERRIAVVGLGTGTLASYGEAGDEFTFYEIDKRVLEIAGNPKYFTYLYDAQKRGVDLKFVLGDARLRLEELAKKNESLRQKGLPVEDEYDLIVVDAFSSDAIPFHLITQESFQQGYLKLLAPRGILAFHISNRHLNLEPVLGDLADSVALTGDRVREDLEDNDINKEATTWVVLARTPEALGELAKDLAVYYLLESDMNHLRIEGVPDSVLQNLGPLIGRGFATRQAFLNALGEYLTMDKVHEHESLLLKHAEVKHWCPLQRSKTVGVWTDNYHPLWSILYWKLCKSG